MQGKAVGGMPHFTSTRQGMRGAVVGPLGQQLLAAVLVHFCGVGARDLGNTVWNRPEVLCSGAYLGVMVLEVLAVLMETLSIDQ